MTVKRLPCTTEDPQYLAPDDVDLFIASHKVGLPCPFCGSGSIVQAKFNKVSDLFGYHVDCNGSKTKSSVGCLSRVSSGGYYTRDEARDEGLRRWNTRDGIQRTFATSVDLRQIIERQGGIV